MSGLIRRREQRGAAMLEFVLAIPFLAVLVFGTVDLGRAYQSANRLHNAAREAANFAQFYPEQTQAGGACATHDNAAWVANHEDGSNAFTVVVQKLAPPAAPVTLTGCKTPQDPASTINPGDRVRVSVSTPFAVITPLVGAIVGTPITMTASEEIVVQG